jgi:hypothetical protein
LRPLLIIDGLTGRETFLQDLLKEIQGLQVRYEARVILGCQAEFDLPGGLTLQPINPATLRSEHKQAIYRFHAGVTDNWTRTPRTFQTIRPDGRW